MTKFQSYIENQNELKPFLPLCHTCDGNTLRNVLESNTLLANSPFTYDTENIVDEDNLYMFYGRPAYRINKTKKPSKIPAYYPICFIFDSKYIEGVKRVFPFDTGAYFVNDSTYSNFFHKDRTLNEFELEADINTPAKLVNLFYSKNKNYYLGIPVENLHIPISEFEVNEYYELIRYKGIAELDDRIATVEVQIGNDLPITNKNLVHIILPSSFKGDKYFYDRLTTNLKLSDSDIETYPTYSGAPSSYFSVILAKIEEFYKNKGFI